MPVDILITQRFRPEKGGSITWLYEVYRRWPSVVEVITHGQGPENGGRPDDSGEAANEPNLEITREDIKLENWGLDTPGRLVRYFRMFNCVRMKTKGAGDVRIHCAHLVPEALSVLPLKFLLGKRVKIAAYAHGEEITACELSRQLSLLLKFTALCVDGIITNSEHTGSMIERYVSRDKITVIHPGVDLKSFNGIDKKESNWLKRREIDPESFIILTVGRLTRRKNHTAVIRAVSALEQKYPNLLYIIAGTGEELERLREETAGLQLKEKIYFAGEVTEEEKRELFGVCDLFVMPSVRVGSDLEGFGIVFLEAAACGKPSIAGRSGGQREAVVDGETGLIVDGENQEEVNAAVHKMVCDGAFRLKAGQKALSFAKEHDWNSVVSRTLKVIDRI